MSQISVSQFRQIALPLEGDNKIRVEGESLHTRSSHSTLGARFVSWIKLHTTGDAKKQADQTSFKTALTAEYGKALGEAAYSAFAPKDGRTHSLTKAQVVLSLEFADRKVNSTLAHLQETLAKTYGKEIAEDVGAQLRSNSLLEDTVIAAKGQTDLSALEARADRMAQSAKAVKVDHDLTTRLEQLKQPGALEQLAETHHIAVDWNCVKPEARQALLAHLENSFKAQTYPVGGKAGERCFLSEEGATAATVPQLKVLAECQRCLPGGAQYAAVLEQVGLTSEDISASTVTKLATELLREGQQYINKLDTDAGLKDLQAQLKDTIFMSAILNTVKQATRGALAAPEFAEQIAAYRPERDGQLASFAGKWLPDLASNDVVGQAKAGAQFDTEHNIFDAAKTQLRTEFELAEISQDAIRGMVASLSGDTLNGPALALRVKQFTKGNASLSQDNLAASIELHLERLRKQDPEGYARFAEAFQSGQLKDNLATLGAGSARLREATDTALLEKATSLGKPKETAWAVSAEIVSAATGTLTSFFGPMLESLRPAEGDQEAFEAQVDAHIGAYHSGEDTQNAANEVARGLFEAFQETYAAHDVSLVFD